METSLEIKVTLGIRKDIAHLFEAVIRAENMKNYFISDASGDMEAGKNYD